MRQRMRRDFRIVRRTDKDLTDLANMFNPILQGWINYYGRFHRSSLQWVFAAFDWALSTWVMRKFKRFKGRRVRANDWLRVVAQRQPLLFAHWAAGLNFWVARAV